MWSKLSLLTSNTQFSFCKSSWSILQSQVASLHGLPAQSLKAEEGEGHGWAASWPDVFFNAEVRHHGSFAPLPRFGETRAMHCHTDGLQLRCVLCAAVGGSVVVWSGAVVRRPCFGVHISHTSFPRPSLLFHPSFKSCASESVQSNPGADSAWLQVCMSAMLCARSLIVTWLSTAIPRPALSRTSHPGLYLFLSVDCFLIYPALLYKKCPLPLSLLRLLTQVALRLDYGQVAHRQDLLQCALPLPPPTRRSAPRQCRSRRMPWGACSSLGFTDGDADQSLRYLVCSLQTKFTGP